MHTWEKLLKALSRGMVLSDFFFFKEAANFNLGHTLFNPDWGVKNQPHFPELITKFSGRVGESYFPMSLNKVSPSLSHTSMT